MIVICPSCMARYRLQGESLALPPTGRSVRCGRCGNTWQATPVDPPPEILPPARSDEPTQVAQGTDPSEQASPSQAQRIDDWGEDAVATEADVDDVEPDELPTATAPHWRAHRRASRHARIRARGHLRVRTGQAGRRWQAFLLGMLLAAAIAAVHYRVDVVRAAPASAMLYEWIGLPVNLRGLDFRNLTARRVFEDGMPVLIIEGEVVNLRKQTSEVPALRIAVRGGRSEELYVWRVDPRQRVLEADESLTVRSRLAVPPGGAQYVELRFVERGLSGQDMR